jgi:hypothetical protein
MTKETLSLRLDDENENPISTLGTIEKEKTRTAHHEICTGKMGKSGCTDFATIRPVRPVPV